VVALGGGVVLPLPPEELPPPLPPLPPQPENPRLATVRAMASHNDGLSFRFLVKKEPQAIRLAQTTRPEVSRHGDEFSFFEDVCDVSVRKLERSAGAVELHFDPTPMLSVAAFGLLVVDGLMK
jgi:hypothetical protein